MKVKFMNTKFTIIGAIALSAATIIGVPCLVNAYNIMDLIQGNARMSPGSYQNDRPYGDRDYRDGSYQNNYSPLSPRHSREGSISQQQTAINLDNRRAQLTAKINAAAGSGRISNNEAINLLDSVNRVGAELQQIDLSQLTFGRAESMMNELNTAENQLQIYMNHPVRGRQNGDGRWNTGHSDYGQYYR